MKFLFIFLFIFLNFSKIYADDPTQITPQNIETLKNFDNLTYQLTNKNYKSLNINKIYNFIQTNKIYKSDFSKLEINLKASAGIDDYDYKNETQRDKNFKKIYLEIEYPIFDEKTKKEKLQNIIKDNNSILKTIQQYAKYYNDFEAGKLKLEFLNLQLIRDKVQVKSGVKNLDDKLARIDKILEAKNNLIETKNLITIYKNILLNYVSNSAKFQLQNLLK